MAETSLLYKAATESLVSDASAVSTFEKMIKVAYEHLSAINFREELLETEKVIRAEFEITSMPGPWRSSKSVLLQCLSMSIGLIDDNGNLCGKTFLQNKIKEAKLAAKTPLTETEYANQIIYKLMHIPPGINPLKVCVEVLSFLKSVPT